MLFFHTADLHIGASMEANLSAEKAAVRRREVFSAFEEIARSASLQKADGVFLCGDIFDENAPSPVEIKEFFDCIATYPDVPFYLISGNHDERMQMPSVLPDNVKLFPCDAFSMYENADVCIYGTQNPTLAPPLMDSAKINFVLLHGQAAFASGEECIDLRLWRDSGADILALGHYHTFMQTPVDLRLQAVYAGCPAGRGFDECGQKGYATYRVKDGKVEVQFVPLKGRSFHTVEIDITNAQTPAQIERCIEKGVAGLDAKDCVKVELIGEISPDLPLALNVLTAAFENHFWFFKIKDKTTLALPQTDLSKDLSLKGAFVRAVMAKETDPLLRDKIIRAGVLALEGKGKEEDVL
ncbi:MAG: DNA repair exonuclease [Clostridia bacterium]|nr:DNA repair exonuclease [Clostridia bacterium]